MRARKFKIHASQSGKHHVPGVREKEETQITGKSKHTLLVCPLCTLMIMATGLNYFTDILDNTFAIKIS